MYLEREKMRKAKEMGAVERRNSKITAENLDKILKVENKLHKMTEVSSTPTILAEYVKAKEVYEKAAAETQTASWKRFCSAQNGKSLWDGIYRVITESGKKQEDVLLQTDSGRVLGPNESTVLAEPFSLMTRSILMIRIMRKSEGKPTGMICHP
ncbi:hypothetical protein EVAR_34698_1 [Eumeta japonica]|uniref:Uncharacterized protein n=1 Tax=Eumeta variegata TaxID=151549 RepID=A0A4C1XE51_EUMVA|nr:hypothetical protein EVAR_34698_1 [Eumeta japonica]